jgi:Acetamidase/Formamidase family
VLPGDTVRYPNTWTHWGNEAVYGMTFAEREPLRHRYPHGPYSMIGPVEVTGAMPGDVIECTPLALRTIDWGWNSFPLGAGALPPAGDQPTSAILAGHYGGNLVLRDLHVGSSIFLPVAKPGGRIWIGDVHALQGDGVVDQTAIETAAENLEIRYDLRRQVGLRGPLAETADSWILIGFADDLDDALTCHPRSDPAVAASRAAGHAMTLSPADRLDILDLLTRADTAASARDIEGYLRLLTADMVLDGDQGTYRGTAPCATRWPRSGPPSRRPACTSRSTRSSMPAGSRAGPWPGQSC